MDLETLTAQFATRQILFWAAAGLLALGASCLVASLVMIVRKVRSRAGRARPGAHANRMAAPSRVGSADSPSAFPLPVVSSYDAPARPSMPDAAEELSMALFLRRLQAAGDRLETIAVDLQTMSALTDESGLKSSLPDVEYVFKAGGA